MATIVDVLADLAPRQQGVVARRQLLAAGISKGCVDSYVRRGWLRVRHAGVYQVGFTASARTRELAAVLACDGVISHRTALVMRRLATAAADDPVDITIDCRRRVQRPGIRVFRSTLCDGDIEQVDGVPVTTLVRTLFDFAGVATFRELERAFAGAEREHRTLRTQLQLLLTRYPTRRGTRAWRTLLRRGVPGFTRSEGEERVLALTRSAGLPEPSTNVMLFGFEVDFYWPAARLVAEVDGYAWHGSIRAFHKDRQRDIALAAAGIQVVRLSWQQLSEERDRTLALLAMAIARGTALRETLR